MDVYVNEFANQNISVDGEIVNGWQNYSILQLEPKWNVPRFGLQFCDTLDHLTQSAARLHFD